MYEKNTFTGLKHKKEKKTRVDGFNYSSSCYILKPYSSVCLNLLSCNKFHKHFCDYVKITQAIANKLLLLLFFQVKIFESSLLWIHIKRKGGQWPPFDLCFKFNPNLSSTAPTSLIYHTFSLHTFGFHT